MIILLTLSISSYFVFNYIHTERVDDAVESVERLQFNAQLSLKKLEEKIKSDPSLAEDPTVQSDMEVYSNNIKELEQEKNAFINYDWDFLLDREISSIKEQIDRSQFSKNMITWMTSFTENVYYERLVWLRENNIRPELPFHFFSELTVYDQVFDFEEIEESVTKNHNKYSSSSIYFLYRLFGILFGVIGIGFFLFLFGDILTKEGLYRSGSIHFLYTQPISRGKVIMSKFIAILMSTVLIIIGSALFSILLGVMFDRLGAWNYPVLIYEANESFHFMPMLLFIVLSALLFFMVLLFCYSLLFFISMITKRTVTAIGVTFGAILLGILFSGTADTNLAPYNPFHYFQIYDIVTMEFAVVHHNFNMTLTNGVLTMGVLSGLLLLGTFGVAKIR